MYGGASVAWLPWFCSYKFLVLCNLSTELDQSKLYVSIIFRSEIVRTRMYLKWNMMTVVLSGLSEVGISDHIECYLHSFCLWQMLAYDWN